MNMILAIFTRGEIIKAVAAAGGRFLDKVREFMQKSSGVLSPVNGDEAWILPAKAFYTVQVYLAGDVEGQRKAIRTADGAREAGQYFYTKTED